MTAKLEYCVVAAGTTAKRSADLHIASAGTRVTYSTPLASVWLDQLSEFRPWVLTTRAASTEIGCVGSKRARVIIDMGRYRLNQPEKDAFDEKCH